MTVDRDDIDAAHEALAEVGAAARRAAHTLSAWGHNWTTSNSVKESGEVLATLVDAGLAEVAQARIRRPVRVYRLTPPALLAVREARGR